MLPIAGASSTQKTRPFLSINASLRTLDRTDENQWFKQRILYAQKCAESSRLAAEFYDEGKKV